MIKTALIILSILQMNFAFAQSEAPKIPIDKKEVIEILDPPGAAALNIMLSALSSFKELKKSEQASIENTTSLVKIKVLPFIDMQTSTQIALEDHWDQLNIAQKQLFINYIEHSLIKDYVGMLHSYKDIDFVEIALQKKVLRKDNKALVKLEIKANAQSKPSLITLKMIRNERWRIYDVVFAGVSVVKNYNAQFNSHIKRKGLDSLIQKTFDKLNQK
ncbi:toluene tolerance protein [Candidatus Thioglobus autotrophicus]|uniref:Toluene tolerance protein n=1 Tax=Candidatus Thioglobus autotrophicus TaxID=1705394 RepID=A0A0M4NJX2_9GAMM|nr:ABC transporter substrate-binding protein [Candidatus Thioglobus autotrophicus]ALE53038.1 toluene tolerance protein [Candidatus Thioglobus autotrophicus]WPE18669.1 ABC transporter substrate-binding protein [Candidatus Thioglobus autotrophicus]